MPTYKITLRRTEYSGAEAIVEADNAKQAKQEVWSGEGDDWDWEYSDGELEIDECLRQCPGCEQTENDVSFSCEDCANCDSCCECSKEDGEPKCTECDDPASKDPLCMNCGRCGYCCKQHGCKQLAGIVELDVRGNAVVVPDEQGFVDGGIPSNE